MPSDSSVVVAAAVVAASVEVSADDVVSVVDAVVLVVSELAFAVVADRLAPPPSPAIAPSASVPGIKIVFESRVIGSPFV